MERLDEYQKDTEQFDDTLVSRKFFYYPIGLCEEAGEAAGKFKKSIRDNDCHLSQQDREDIADELGDVMWYVARMAAYLGFPLSRIADMNHDKLMDRKIRGKISGSGDKR